MSGILIFLSLLITIVGFALLWAEDVWADFFKLGPPFEIGSIVIETWGKWWSFVILLILYQSTTVYFEETVGREFERKHIQKKDFNTFELFTLSCYNIYRWLGTILHILIAVSRLDIWLCIAVIDTFVRLLLWRKQKGGRLPRSFL